MSPGLLLLLLVSSCLPVSSAPPDYSDDEGETNQGSRFGFWKKCRDWVRKNCQGNIETAINVLDGLGCAPVSAVLKTMQQKLPQEDKLSPVMSDLKELQVKFDNLCAEMRWDAWAPSAYLVPVNNIEKAWDKYTNDKESFYTYYSQYEDSTSVLHRYLTAKPDSVVPNLGDVLAARFKCHEKDVKAQFLHFIKLIYRGNMLDESYHRFKGTNTRARVAAANKMASQSASALFASYQRCISDSAPYIERDIFEHIDDSKKHQDIANNIRAFLEKTYDRYDWMVVAFSTENSKHIPRWMKRHVLSGFTEVARGTVTVAAAKQVKGGDTKADDVIKAIDKCLQKKSVVCSDVKKKIQGCKERVFGKRVFQTITAMHTFKAKSQTSSSAVEAPRSDEESELTESTVSTTGHHLYTGKCGKWLGKFIILIKSDEEIMGVDPCSKVKCLQKEKCVVVPRTSIGLCKCQYPHYGDRCEMSLETSWKPDRLRRAMLEPPANRRSHTQGWKTRSKSLQPQSSARRRSRSGSRARRRSRRRRPARRRSRRRRPARRKSRRGRPARRRSRSGSRARRRSRSGSPAGGALESMG